MRSLRTIPAPLTRWAFAPSAKEKPIRVLRDGPFESQPIQADVVSGLRLGSGLGRFGRGLRSVFDGRRRSLAAAARRRAVVAAGSARCTGRAAGGAAARCAMAGALHGARIAAGRGRSAGCTGRLSARAAVGDLDRVALGLAARLADAALVARLHLRSHDSHQGRQCGSRQQSLQHGLTPHWFRLGSEGSTPEGPFRALMIRPLSVRSISCRRQFGVARRVVCTNLVDHGESAGYNSGRAPEVKPSALPDSPGTRICLYSQFHRLTPRRKLL